MTKVAWRLNWKRLVAIVGGISAGIAALAAISSNLATISGSLQKAYSLVAPRASGIRIESVDVDPEITGDAHAYTYIIATVEVSISNGGDRDATNCKAVISAGRGTAEAPLNTNLPGHGTQSQFRLRFSLHESYRTQEALKIYCDGLISNSFAVTLPKYPLSSD